MPAPFALGVVSYREYDPIVSVAVPSTARRLRGARRSAWSWFPVYLVAIHDLEMGESVTRCAPWRARSAVGMWLGFAIATSHIAAHAQSVPDADSSNFSFADAFATLGAPQALTASSPDAVDLSTLDIPRGPAVLEDLGSGVASYYGKRFHGRRTANGERFDMTAMTAAHKTLPFGTYVRVTNRSNRRSVTVRINDRGPFIRGRTIDLSRAAAEEIGMIQRGHASVTMEIVAP